MFQCSFGSFTQETQAPARVLLVLLVPVACKDLQVLQEGKDIWDTQEATEKRATPA